MHILDQKNDITLSSKTDIYKDVRYTVTDKFEMSIGNFSEPARLLLEKYSATCGVFVTAWNHYGQFMSESENEFNTLCLVNALESSGVVYFDGVGVSRDGNWSEKSLFVIEPTGSFLLSMFTEYKQNTYVKIENTGMVELIFNPFL